MSKKEKSPKEYRGVIDEIRQQQMKTKEMSAKGKLEYFWDYYKVHTIVAILVIFFAAMFIRDIVTAKDYNFYSILFNARQLSGDSLESAFSEYAGLDTENYECYIDASTGLSLTSFTEYDMATVQKLMATIQIGDLDTVVFNSELFNNYAGNEMFLDLRTILSEEELNAWKDYLYYIDYVEVAAEREDVDVEEAPAEKDAADDETRQQEILEETNRHRSPEGMAEPVPVGIFMEASPFAEKSGAYSDLVPVFGFVSTSKRTETGKQFLEFLWDDTIDFAQMIDTSTGF
ncbi:hypothetical protein AALB47_07690 [Lachnospiraceae bacterium 54-11]|jgi:hypothetical protein|nr:hypothetical protein [Lachnospiraceae bacterium]